MFKTKADTNGDCVVGEISRTEIVDIIEKKSRKRLGISAKKMIERYRSGKLDNVGEVADLIVLAGALPKNDPLFV